MGTVLKGATLVELEPASVEEGELRLVDGRIVARGVALEEPGDEVFELGGRLVLAGMVSAHHHLYAAPLRGLKREGAGPAAERLAVERLESVLTAGDIVPSARAGGLEGLMCGTTCVIDLHVSPRAIEGSLARVCEALDGLGLRGVLSYEASERYGDAARDKALAESAAFAASATGRFRGAIGLSHLDVVSDDTLKVVADLCKSKGLFFLATIGEDAEEETRSLARFGKPPIDRIFEHGLVGPRTVLAQAVHLSWPDLSRIIATGAFLVHSPRSNMASQTGLAHALKFGVHGCLGTDTLSLDVLSEAQAAWLRASDAGQPIDVLRFLANGHRIASEAFGCMVGPLRESAVADLVVSDYQPLTPLNEETLASHLLYGLSARTVESVMVDGIWRVWKRRPLVDADAIAQAARNAALAAWARIS